MRLNDLQLFVQYGIIQIIQRTCKVFELVKPISTKGLVSFMVVIDIL